MTNLNYLKGMFMFLSFLFFMNVSFAADKTWDGSESSDWNDPLNWSGGTLPTSTDKAIIDAGSYTNAPVISADSDFSIDDLIVRNSGVLTISADLTVEDDVHINGGTITITAGVVTVDDDCKFEDRYNANASNGTLNVSGGSLIIGITGDGQLDFSETGTNNVVNISGGGEVTAVETIGGNQNVSGDPIGTTPFTSPITTTITLAQDYTFPADLTISVGGQLNISNGFTLELEGSLTNNGTLDSQDGSIISITAASDISGTGTTTFDDLTIAAAVTLSQAINVTGDFTVQSGSFTPNTSAVSLTGSVAQALDDQTGTGSFYDLTINQGTASTITLNSPFNISNQLTLTSGVIASTATNLLKLTDGATISGGDADSYVTGPLAKIGNEAFTFPVGDGSTFRSIGISAPGVATDEFTAEYHASSHGDTGSLDGGGTLNNVSVLEYWDLDRTGGTSDVRVTLYWTDADAEVIKDLSTDLKVAHYDGTDWDGIASTATGTLGSGGSGSVTTDAVVTTFSPFSFGSGGGANPLPVELISFKGKVKNGQSVVLSWVTASEINNDYFDVEFSVNGKKWESLDRVAGKGTTYQLSDYSIEYDLNQNIHLAYFRLKQVDFDGVFEYSDAISVGNQSSNISSMSVVNNGSSQPSILLESIEEDIVVVEVFNSLGLRIGVTTIKMDKSAKLINLSSFGLLRGSFFVKTTGRYINQVQRVVVID